MGIDRRNFLRLAGIATVSGFGLKEAVSGKEPIEEADDKKGKRFGLVFDMRKCREQGDCDKCKQACHIVHNVPEIENKNHEIKWIWKEEYGHAFPTQIHEFISDKAKKSPLLVLCNHCEHPPCVNVCPTQATFKRESDGVVMMDFHRCIGCRYCMAGCPYGARSFNWKDPRPYIKDKNSKFPTRTKGVVEKCNLCAERIAKNQLPACVEACEAKAITFGDLNDPNSEIRNLLSENDTIRRKPHLHTLPNVYYIM